MTDQLKRTKADYEAQMSELFKSLHAPYSSVELDNVIDTLKLRDLHEMNVMFALEITPPDSNKPEAEERTRMLNAAKNFRAQF
jgi:hypothetical protein